MIAFCGFSDPFAVQTPYFKILLTPFEGGGLVAVREEGRYLLVTDEEFSASAFLEVKVDSPAAYPELSGLSGPEGLLSQAPKGLQCKPTTVKGIDWVRCQSSESPQNVTYYFMAGGAVYSVAFDPNASRASGEAIKSMFDSLRLARSDD